MLPLDEPKLKKSIFDIFKRWLHGRR
jgi:hypothetical protein